MDSEEFDQYVVGKDALFHYTRLSVALEDILSAGRLKTATLERTNDPQEYKFKSYSMFGWSQPDNVDQTFAEAAVLLDRMVRKECRILCFCSNNRPKLLQNGIPVEDPIENTLGWAKPRMWSQYGENHHGICLVLSKSELEKQIRSACEQKCWVHADDVEYSSSERLSFESTNINYNSVANVGVRQYCVTHVEIHRKALFFSKHLDYRDESEFRFVAFDPDGLAEYVDIRSSIKGIIAGDRTNEVYFPIIRRLSKKLNVEARQAFWQDVKPYLIGLTDQVET